jgi:drug/metabolite transporter (DMT)-like permease
VARTLPADANAAKLGTPVSGRDVEPAPPTLPPSTGRAAPPPTGRAVGAVVLGALGIAFSAIFVRWALPAPPVVTAFYRMLLALPWLAAIVAIGGRGGRRRRASPRDLALATLAGAWLGADLAVWHLALVKTSVATATLLVNTTPIPVGLYAAWVLREPPDARFVVGVALALTGTATLLGVDRASLVHLEGDALALAAALFYAAYLVSMKRARRTLDVGPAILATSVGAVAVTGAFAALRGDPFTGFPAHSWAAFAAAAVVSQVGGVLGIAWGLRWLRATFASLTLLVQPVATALLGWWLLSEPVGPGQAVGAVGVLAGILVASRTGLDPAAHPGPDRGARDTPPGPVP